LKGGGLGERLKTLQGKALEMQVRQPLIDSNSLLKAEQYLKLPHFWARS
jgi:hypothetical protein